MILTPDEMLKSGLLAAGFEQFRLDKKNEKTKKDLFKSFYGVSSLVCCQIWEDLQTTDIQEAHIDCAMDRRARITNFFIALHFLFRYPTVQEQAIIFKMSVPTIRDISWYFTRKIEALFAMKVSFLKSVLLAFLISITC